MSEKIPNPLENVIEAIWILSRDIQAIAYLQHKDLPIPSDLFKQIENNHIRVGKLIGKLTLTGNHNH